MVNFILVSPNEILANRLKLLCEISEEFCLKKHFFEHKMATEFLKGNKVDFLILDLFLFDADSLAFAQKTKMSFPELQIVLVTDFISKELVNCCKRVGILTILTNDVSYENLCEVFSKETCAKSKENVQQGFLGEMFDKEKFLDEKISKICLSVGISPKNLGYLYFKEAIKIVSKNPKIMGRITKELYPAVANKFSTNVASVERALRHSLDMAFSTESFENLNHILECEVVSKHKRISSGEFIALVADKISLDFL